MEKILRLLLGVTIKPFLEKYYLKKNRTMTYKGIVCSIHTNVFHPGLFFSSKFLADFLCSQKLRGKNILDLGCGSGFLSLIAAKLGANVTSADISPLAIKNTQLNAAKNQLNLTLLKSDLFDEINTLFDIIIINPPYFPKAPDKFYDYAWYCGDNYQYYEKFFYQLQKQIRKNQIFMVLSDQCHLDKIFSVALKNGFKMAIVAKKNYIIEKNYIFQISSV